MASANSTSSPRDHVADANPDLARKKQRLSEEPGRSPDDSVIIEVCEPEDIGTNVTNAIEIEDEGFGIMMDPYADDFRIMNSPLSAYEQLGSFEAELNSNCYVDPSTFITFAQALEQHIERSIHESDVWRQHYVEDELDFFSRLASLSSRLLEMGDLFEPNQDIDNPVMRQAFAQILDNLHKLCCRIIPLLPDAIKATLSRRDSTQVSARQQSVGVLLYVTIALRIMGMGTPTIESFRFHGEFKSDDLAFQMRAEFFQAYMFAALAKVIQTLSGAMREVKEAWATMHNSLHLMFDGSKSRQTIDDYPKQELEDVIEVINDRILPAVCEKHPNALPTVFHIELVTFAATVLEADAVIYDFDSACHLYDRFVNNVKDFLMMNEVETETTSVALWRMCGEDQAVLARLLSVSWSLQAHKSFICSSIMDIRNIGISSLAQLLQETFNNCKDAKDGSRDLILKYAAWYLRQNELTEYIFGPMSRAGLVSHSPDIVCFLAATSSYTDHETDIIWRACSTSVEADFVKASFGVLHHVLAFLTFEQLLYVSNKYSSTPVSKLGPDAIHLLPKLMMAIEARGSDVTEQSHRLATVFSSIEILKLAMSSPRCASTAPLQQIAMTEIGRFASPSFTLNDRAEIYKYCVPEIRKRTQHATTAVEVLSVFLNVQISIPEAEHILSMLPVSEAVAELCDFVRAKNGSRDIVDTNCIAVRLGCIVRLMALSKSPRDEDDEKRLFTYVFGESALSGPARNIAWDKLHAMTLQKSPPSAAVSLWTLYMANYVPSISTNLATPKLMDLSHIFLRAECGDARVRADYIELLDVPLWKALVKFATRSTNPMVVRSATGVILDLLFVFPNITTIPRSPVVKCHRAFIRGHIENLCRESEELPRSTDGTHVRKLLQGIDLLDAILVKSREMAWFYGPAEKQDVFVISDSTDAVDHFVFTAQVYGPEVQPTVYRVRARESTKVSEVLGKVREITGTVENRIIAGGSEITHQPNKTLSEAGVKRSGVLMICPKYTFSHDLDGMLTCPGPVEQEILTQYNFLEAFVDGPDPVGQKAFVFLRNIHPSAQSRFKVASTEASAQDLFPVDRPWRTMYSIHVLQRHLLDFSKLAVADKDFVLRGVHLLTAYVLDDTRPFHPQLIAHILRVLLVFLREAPISETPLKYFEHGGQVASRMIELLFKAKQLPIEYTVDPINRNRTELAVLLYKILLQASQNDAELWKTFSQSDETVVLHRQLLLDEDPNFSFRLATPIQDICQDTGVSREVPHFYWNMVIASLSEALDKGELSESYFELAVVILHTDQTIQTDETNVRDLIERLSTDLWSYQHSESLTLQISDRALSGLLKLLGTATNILRSYKKPLQLQGLSTKILEQLLFPRLEDPEHHQLVHTESRGHAFDLVQWSFEAEVDYEHLIDIACGAVQCTLKQPTATFPGHADWIRPPSNYGGLRNLGMTCYMNSLLQQLFNNLQFRKFLLDLPQSQAPRRDVLECVQALFTRMQSSVEPVLHPSHLAQALGVQVGSQEDVHGFYSIFLSNLEDAMPDGNSKQALAKFFTGKSVTQVKAECGHVSTRSEPFNDLSITVKNKASLHDSLNEFVQGEPLEGSNRYKCMTCCTDDGGRLVNAMRRTCFDELPDTLTFCLKRFTYESMILGDSKVNDRFDFPREIDMSPYKRSHLDNPEAPSEPDMFELVGVIVHQGSLDFGHYWSYVRVPGSLDSANAIWMCVEDNKSRRCADGIREVQEQCFGGLKWSNGNDRPDNAYVLFYQRKGYILQADSINTVPKNLRLQYGILPTVDLSDDGAAGMLKDNLWRHRIACLFDRRFGTFTTWLLDQFPSVLEARNTRMEETSESSEASRSSDYSDPELESKVAELIVSYALRVMLADPLCEPRVAPLMSSLTNILATSPTASSHILRHFAQDLFGFTALLHNKSQKARSQMFNFLETCISCVRERDPDNYKEILTAVVNSHSGMVGEALDASFGQWKEYLAFVANLARQGMFETGIILEKDYLSWVLEVLSLRGDADLRKKHQSLWNWTKGNALDLSPLYDFLFHLFSEHMDLSEDYERLATSRGQRTKTSRGWCLISGELNTLFRSRPIGEKETWLILYTACRDCTADMNWKDFAPGKLLGLLASDKVNYGILRFVEGSMISRYEQEDHNLQQLLNMTLHLCVNRSDQECKGPLRILCQNLTLWDQSFRLSLYFLREAYKLVPCAVVENIPVWAEEFLSAKGPTSRKTTADWLQDHLFKLPPLSDNTLLDAVRIRSTRILFGQCYTCLHNAYGKEAARTRYESMIETMQNAEVYLSNLEREVARKREEEPASLGPQVVVEFDESRPVLLSLRELLADLSEWESELSLPNRSISVRRSVELDSEDLDESDGEELSGSGSGGE